MYSGRPQIVLQLYKVSFDYLQWLLGVPKDNLAPLNSKKSIGQIGIKADSDVAGDCICIWPAVDCLIFIKKDLYGYKFKFGTSTVETLQKDFDLIIFCLLCWYSSGIICTSLRIRMHSLHICTVVKFYNYILRLQCGCLPMRYYPPRVLL